MYNKEFDGFFKFLQIDNYKLLNKPSVIYKSDNLLEHSLVKTILELLLSLLLFIYIYYMKQSVNNVFLKTQHSTHKDIILKREKYIMIVVYFKFIKLNKMYFFRLILFSHITL